MPPPLIGGGIKRWCCLTSDVRRLVSVWRLSVAYIGPKSSIEWPRKSQIGTEVDNVTRDSDTTFKVKGQGHHHQAALLTVARTREAGAAVTVRTYWAWETTLRLLGGARGGGAPTGEERGGGISCRHAHSFLGNIFFQKLGNWTFRTHAN